MGSATPHPGAVPRTVRSRKRAIAELLADLGPQQLRRAEADASASSAVHLDPSCATGLDDVDRLLGGGFPLGRLAEISGPHSSGRTSVALALLAETTRRGECAALIDPGDAFDPPSAEELGVHLERVLWARPRGERETLRATERLLETDGFPLVLLDLVNRSGARLRDDPWLRLSRLAAGTRTALVVVSDQRVTGSRAQLALEMQPAGAHFAGEAAEPPLLDRLETRAVLVRHRAAPPGATKLQLAVRAA